jgi:hypothetical protein
MSRETDALIAEHVMDAAAEGMKVCRTLDELKAATHWPWASADLPVLAGLGIRGIPDYSTNITAAWRVRAKMRERGWVMRLGEREDGTWGVEFIDTARTLDIDGHHLAQADTAEAAICIAALRALGVTP